MNRNGLSRTPEYSCWKGMISRCYNPKDTSYPNYGARGISVCAQWMWFNNFLKDIGVKPSPIHQIDRVNNDGNYEPGNCRWVEPKVNCRNKRSTRILTIDGESMPMVDWATRTAVSYTLIHARLKLGWAHKKAVFQAVDHRKGRRK